MTMICYDCKHATWDYHTFYNTTDRQWFVDGCKLEETADPIQDEYGGVVKCNAFDDHFEEEY